VGEAPDEAEVLDAGQVLVDGGVLAGQADRVTDGLGVGDDVVTEDTGLAGVGPQDRGEDPDGGRLAGAVGAEEAEHGAGRDGEIDPVEGGDVSEPLDEAGGDDGGLPGVGGVPQRDSHTPSIGQILGLAK